jgi:uncharacterized protein YdeI (YjbR/CyaY-like superfamily)
MGVGQGHTIRIQRCNDDEDLLEALAKDKKAEMYYHSLNKSNKFAINFRLQTAKKPETKTKRLLEIIAMLKDERKFH